MNRKQPSLDYLNTPCLSVAIGSALNTSGVSYKTSYDNGYTTLNDANELIRETENIYVIKRFQFKRGERPLLNELKDYFNMNNISCSKAIVCVTGHYLYYDLDNDTYYSFFDNDTDEVINVWSIEIL